MLFGDFKDICMPKAQLSVRYNDGKLVIQANSFAKFVQIIPEQFENITIEDNYFDILPCEQKSLLLQSDIHQQIEIKAFNGESLFIRI